jgi:hypothetical protein
LSFGTQLAWTQAHFFGITSAQDATMDEDYGKMSREALARANEISERVFFWGLVHTVVVFGIAMLKGIFMFGSSSAT